MSETQPEANRTEPPGSPEPLVKLEPATVTADQLADLQARAAKAEENWDRLLRTAADFENFKRRAARDKQDAVRFANQSLMEKLMPILDSMEMAMASIQNSPDEAARSLQTGLTMIHQQFKNALAESGLEEVDATGKKFDPQWHEAVSEQETAEAEEGHVIQQLRKGYKLRDRLLRPASVVVAKSPTKDPA